MTDLQKIRMNIQDKNSVIFTDDELTSILTDEGNVDGASAKALEIMAMMPESLIISYSRGDISFSKQSLLDMAKYYRDKDPLGIYTISRSDFDWT
jgi:hypothetical protein